MKHLGLFLKSQFIKIHAQHLRLILMIFILVFSLLGACSPSADGSPGGF